MLSRLKHETLLCAYLLERKDRNTRELWSGKMCINKIAMLWKCFMAKRENNNITMLCIMKFLVLER